MVYFEDYGDIMVAIKREKQLKKYHRKWKEELIGEMNPDGEDLSENWFDPSEFKNFMCE